MSIKKLSAWMILVVVILSTACHTEKNKRTRPAKAEFQATEDGLYYYFHEQSKDSAYPRDTEYVTVLMTWGKRDSLIVTHEMTGGPVEFRIQPVPVKGTIFDALKMMSVGDSATFIINADKYFGSNQLPEFITPGSELYFDFRLQSIKSESEYNREKYEYLARLKNEEPRKINNYLKKNKIEVEPLESGLYFILTASGEGPRVEEGKMVTINYEYFLIDGKKLYSTWDAKKPMEFRFGTKFDTPGMNEALSMMRAGDKAQLIVPSTIGYGEQGRAQFIPPYATLLYEVEVLDVVSVEAYKAKNAKIDKARQKMMARQKELDAIKKQEPRLIEQYIQSHDIDEGPLAMGMYYVEIEEGSGYSPQPGDKVKVHYTLYNLKDKLLETTQVENKPFDFTLGRQEVILGWEVAIRKMKPGGKARIILPSKMAYGEKGAGSAIPPYTPLVYEIELLEVTERETKSQGRK